MTALHIIKAYDVSIEREILMHDDTCTTEHWFDPSVQPKCTRYMNRWCGRERT